MPELATSTRLVPPLSIANPILLRWLIGVRWVVFGLLAATLPAGEQLFGFHIRYAVAVPVIAIVAAGNAVAYARMRAQKPASSRSVAAAVALDLVAIGAILAASGGAANPFSAVFFEHLLGAGADSWVLVVKIRFERLAALARDDALPHHAAFQIVQGLPICKFLSAEFRALATDVTGMAAT